MCRLSMLFTLLSLTLVLAAQADSGITSLQHNPFTRPAIGSEATAQSVRTPILTRPEYLRATLVAGKHSLANVDGTLVAIGENIDGYRLIEVSDGSATFATEGETFTVTVGEKDLGNNDD